MTGATVSDGASNVDPASYSDDLRQILSVLLNSKREHGEPWMSAVDISHTLTESHGIRLHWRTINKLLLDRRDLVTRRKRRKRWEFSILAEGERLVSAPDAPIILTDPSKAIQATVTLHGFLSSLKDPIRICDPYLDASTIEHLDACPTGSTIQLLTRNIRNSGKLRRLLSAARVEGYSIEIRVAPKNDLHDRYIVDADSMLILGTSLNGFGRKQSFITKAGQDIRQTVLKEFESRWNHATLWP